MSEAGVKAMKMNLTLMLISEVFGISTASASLTKATRGFSIHDRWPTRLIEPSVPGFS